MKKYFKPALGTTIAIVGVLAVISNSECKAETGFFSNRNCNQVFQLLSNACEQICQAQDQECKNACNTRTMIGCDDQVEGHQAGAYFHTHNCRFIAMDFNSQALHKCQQIPARTNQWCYDNFLNNAGVERAAADHCTNVND